MIFVMYKQGYLDQINEEAGPKYGMCFFLLVDLLTSKFLLPASTISYSRFLCISSN